MGFEDKYMKYVEKALAKDHVKRIMLLQEQGFPVDSIAAVYEKSVDEVKDIIEKNRGGYEWGMGGES